MKIDGIKGFAGLFKRRWYIAAPVMMLVLLAIVVQAHGGSIDPTDPRNYNAFELVNDTAAPQYVRLCKDAACHHFYGEMGWEQVPTGQALRVQVSWGRGESSSYAVSSNSVGQPHGCLRLLAPTKQVDPQRVALSMAASCPP